MKDSSFKCHVWNIENNENIKKLYDQKLASYDMLTLPYELYIYIYIFLLPSSLPWNDIIYGRTKWNPPLNEIYHQNALGNKTFGDILFTST